ncbi:MAG: chorismate mutase [Pseudomonadota bacterium]
MTLPKPRTPQEQLSEFRASIDNFDAALIHILAERFRITKAVGELKAANDFPPSDPAREKDQIDRLRSLAESSQLDPDFAEQFLEFVIREVIQHHKKAADHSDTNIVD